jgi:glycyl-tRNA synthetase beta chain
VRNFSDYTEKLRNSFVIVKAEERRKIIVQKANDLAEEHRLLLHTDEFLMSENTGLVEWPVVLLGSFSETFLTLPDEVLVTSMKRHQKYIPLYQRDGRLAPHFVVVSNLMSDDDGAAIVAGNERVQGPSIRREILLGCRQTDFA